MAIISRPRPGFQEGLIKTAPAILVAVSAGRHHGGSAMSTDSEFEKLIAAAEAYTMEGWD